MNSTNFSKFIPSEIANLKYFEIISNKIIRNLITGINKSPFSGHSIEFKDYRKYQYGDDLKQIDWKLYARTDKLFIKKYEKKVNLDLHIFLDSSKSMDYGSNTTKFIYAKYISAILSGVALKQNDNVYLYSFSEDINKITKKITKFSEINLVYKKLKDVQTSTDTNYNKVLKKMYSIKDSMIFIISDLWGDINKIINISKYGRANNNELNFFHILSDTEMKFDFKGNIEFVDSESQNTQVLSTKQIKKYYKDEINKRIKNFKKTINLHDNNYLLLLNSSNLFSSLYKYFMNRGTNGF